MTSKEAQQRYRQSPKGRASRQRVARRHQLKHKYGLTLERFEEMLEAQGGVCAICGKPETGKGRNHLSVDHDHKCCNGEKSCGKCIRALLCNRCNNCLGWYERNMQAVTAIVERAFS